MVKKSQKLKIHELMKLNSEYLFLKINDGIKLDLVKYSIILSIG